MIRPGRPEAAEAVLAALATRPDAAPAARARVRGVAQAAVALAASGGFAWLGHRGPAIAAGVIGVCVAAAAIVSPSGAFAAIDRGVATLGRGIGRAITWVLLPAIFFGFFVPFGLLFRRGRRDAMKRRFEPDAASYWTPADPRRQTPDAHARQY